MRREVFVEAKKKALELFDKASIVLTEEERENLEVADFGLDDVFKTGLNIVTYVNTKLCCAKEMVLFPGQTCPEHVHAPMTDIGYIGKEETFRCRYGEVYLYVAGDPTHKIQAKQPDEHYTVFHEIVLKPGEQYTLYPNTLHWFQGGPDGAVVSEFSTASHDEYDFFTNPNIQRMPTIED